MIYGLNDLTIKDYKGNYLLTNKIKINISNLDTRLIEQANRIKCPLFPVSAIGIINSKKDVILFRTKIFPLEVAKRYFREPSELIETIGLNKVVAIENCGLSGNHKLTPRIIANRELNMAYNNVYSVVIREEPENFKKITNLWNL